VYGNIKRIDDISIMHTGYAETEYREKDKAERNIRMLRAELAERPNDLTIKAYLADSLISRILLSENPNADDQAEIDGICNEVIDNIEKVPVFLRKKLYYYHLSRLLNNPEKSIELEQLCKKAHSEFPEEIGFIYHYAVILNKTGKYAKAGDILYKAEALQTAAKHKASAPVKTIYVPAEIIGQQLLAAQGLGDVDNTIKYAAALLAVDNTQQSILSPYIHTLLKKGTSYDELLGILGDIYNIGNPNDLLLIAHAAKACGAIEFASLVVTIAKEIM
jgi:tetratricopeptide (TPR) repeat protein